MRISSLRANAQSTKSITSSDVTLQSIAQPYCKLRVFLFVPYFLLFPSLVLYCTYIQQLFSIHCHIIIADYYYVLTSGIFSYLSQRIKDSFPPRFWLNKCWTRTIVYLIWGVFFTMRFFFVHLIWSVLKLFNKAIKIVLWLESCLDVQYDRKYNVLFLFLTYLSLYCLFIDKSDSH